jgi:ketol-acid reductoisomerase
MKVTIFGYGSQGQAQARILHESGHEVLVFLREGSPRISLAKKHGISVTSSLDETVQVSDTFVLLMPDEEQARFYHDHLKGKLPPKSLLVVAHGFSIEFGGLVPDSEIDVALVGPKEMGPKVYEMFQSGEPLSVVWSVYQDASGDTKRKSLDYALAIGAQDHTIISTNIHEETVVDLFGEQAVILGPIIQIMRHGFEVLTEAGYSEDMAYSKCINQMRLVTESIARHGIQKTRHKISKIAAYGEMTRGERVIDENVKSNMKRVLREIESGSFAKEYLENEKSFFKNENWALPEREQRLEEFSKKSLTDLKDES